jgi:hypothetical protein
VARTVDEQHAATACDAGLSRATRWLRNLCFAAAIVVGMALFAASLAPATRAARERGLSWRAFSNDVFHAAVERIDTAMAARWEAQSLQPAERAGDLAIARRLSLAVTGTVPSLEEIRRFEARGGEDRIAWWLAGTLADERSSDYLAERLARAFVGTDEGPFLIYRRRRFVAWLAEQLRENRPYDQIVRELIASDGLWTNVPATNFLTATVKQENKGPDESALAARVSRAMLGIRLDCAECHDHPFEPWRQEQFRGLAAFFGRTEQTLTGIREGKKPPTIEDPNSGEKVTVEPAVPFQPELVGDERNSRLRLAHWVTHPRNKAFARAAVNRFWALLFGRALVEPVDNLHLDEPLPEVLEVLADDFVANRYDLRRLIGLIASSRAFQLDSAAATDEQDMPLAGRELTAEHDAAWAAFPITRLRPEQVVGSLLQASSLATIDYESHIVIRIARAIGQNEFVKRYGDAGEDELDLHGGTIPQRLLMMNGTLVDERTEAGNFLHAPTRIAMLAPNDPMAIETAYLAVLTRRPSSEEAEHFATRLRDTRGGRRQQVLEDLYWSLLNSTEFSWNH